METIRSATPGDGARLVHLLESAGLDDLARRADVATCLDCGFLLVLDLGDSLGAAAYVALESDSDQTHARLRFLAIHPALRDTDAADRIAIAVIAVCEASGCVDLDLDLDRSDSRR
jgi:N-acetylglutamate synthase-like GNAT family acetyltransferase